MKEIKRVDIMSCAKVSAALGAIVGFIAGLIVTIVSLAVGSMAAYIPDATATAPWLMGMMGALSIIVMPILYAITGFVSGAIMAFLYNIVAEKIGGVEIDI